MVRLTDRLGKTIVVDWDVKAQIKQNKQILEITHTFQGNLDCFQSYYHATVKPIFKLEKS